MCCSHCFSLCECCKATIRFWPSYLDQTWVLQFHTEQSTPTLLDDMAAAARQAAGAKPKFAEVKVTLNLGKFDSLQYICAQVCIIGSSTAQPTGTKSLYIVVWQHSLLLSAIPERA